MLRIDALREVYPLLKDQLVVTIMGAVAAELYSLGHRPNFFYLEHAMGVGLLHRTGHRTIPSSPESSCP